MWTSPKTWVDGDIILRSDFDTYLRNQQREMAPFKVTTKGDMVIGTGSNAIARLGVGTDRFLLRYDSAQGLGVRWAGDAVPPGLIILFTAACPSGWTEYATSQGRAIVGTPSGGTDEGTVGNALTDSEDRTHTHTGPSHRHSYSTFDRNTTTGSARAVSSDPTENTAFAGTGATTTAAISGSLPYIQLRLCERD